MNKILLFIFVFCQGFSALGIDYIFDNGDPGNSNWNDNDNWVGGNAPSSTTILAADSIIISCSCTVILTADLSVNGGLSIMSGSVLDVSGNDVELLVETATFTNAGELKAKKLKNSVNGLLEGEGPFMTNSGTLTISDELKIGEKPGSGKLTNSGTINAKKMHVDGDLENNGLINLTEKADLHGAYMTGTGTISSPLIKMHEEAGSIAEILQQNFISPSGCTDGASNATPLYEVNGSTYTFQALLDTFGSSELGEFSLDPSRVSSCGESGASALPVEFLYFIGASNQGSVELSWSTATEKNNDHFEIENSVDGLSFSKIGEVKGNGTTNEVMKYAFVDESPQGIESYYRLKQVDYDGQHAYFNTIRVQITASSGIKIYPNPTSTNSTLVVQLNNSLEPGLVNVELTDLTGRIIQKKLGHGNSFELSTKSLVKGTYFVRVSINSLVFTSKILVD